MGPGGRRIPRVAHAVAATGAVNALAMLLGIVSGVLTARGLGVEDRGTLVSLLVWSATIGSLSLTGIDEAIIFRSGGSSERAWSLRRVVARDAALQTAVGCCVLACVAYYIVRPSSLAGWVTVWATVMIVPLNTVSLMGVAPLRAGRRLRLWNAVRLTPPVIYAAGACVLWATGTLTILTGVVAQLVGGALTCCALIGLARNEQRTPLSVSDRRAALSYGRRLIIASLPQRISPRADQLLISLMMAPSVLGVYSVATSIAAVILMIGRSLDQVLFPQFSASHYSIRALLKATWVSMSAGIALSVCVLLVAGPAIGILYGEDFVGAVEPLAILLAAAVFRIGSQCFGAALKASGELRIYSVAQLAGLITLILVFLSALQWGDVGAATASLAGAVVTFAVLSAGIRLGPRSPSLAPAEERG